MQTNKAWVVIPAAGVGKRMQSAVPKQYLSLQGKTVLEHTLAVFLACPLIAGIVVVVSAEDAYWPELAAAYTQRSVYTAEGGKERADSVLAGLEYLSEQLALSPDTLVLVHDAARPCLSQHDLNQLLAHAEYAHQGVLLATPVRDTMKRAIVGSQQVAHTEERQGLWHALTPQMAPLGLLRSALQTALQANAMITDEASALERLGLHPYLVEGEASNLKITRPADLALAAFFLPALEQERC